MKEALESAFNQPGLYARDGKKVTWVSVHLCLKLYNTAEDGTVHR